MPKKTGLFASARFRTLDKEGPFASKASNAAFAVDTPDGVHTDFGLGPYAVGGDRGRTFSEGAGTEKGGSGNASGKGRTMRLKGD